MNAHATSTPMGDDIEERTKDKVLHNTSEGRERQRALVSSTKGAIGNLLGGTGAIEAEFIAMSTVDDLVPPTKNLTLAGLGDKADTLSSFQHS